MTENKSIYDQILELFSSKKVEDTPEVKDEVEVKMDEHEDEVAEDAAEDEAPEVDAMEARIVAMEDAVADLLARVIALETPEAPVADEVDEDDEFRKNTEAAFAKLSKEIDALKKLPASEFKTEDKKETKKTEFKSSDKKVSATVLGLRKRLGK